MTIDLQPSSPEWPTIFADESDRIRRALGGLAVDVHHTGSTSVPGLRAKPIIDITMGVPDSTDEDAYLPRLVDAGYEFLVREPDWFEHRLFKRVDPRVNLHVFTIGSPEIERMLVFRDHLRVNESDRALYESKKVTLAEREWETVQSYADAKTEVVEAILARATMLSVTDRCAQCGFIYDLSVSGDAGRRITTGVEQVATLLELYTDVVERPDPGTWSVLEYCCHLRDVLLVQRERVLLARRADRPALVPMGRDERVEHDGYADQQPTGVARQLRDAASLFTGVLARLDDEAWNRTVIYNYPTPTVRDLKWVAVHTQHEVVHHLADLLAQTTSHREA